MKKEILKSIDSVPNPDKRVALKLAIYFLFVAVSVIAYLYKEQRSTFNERRSEYVNKIRMIEKEKDSLINLNMQNLTNSLKEAQRGLLEAHEQRRVTDSLIRVLNIKK